MKLSKTMLQAMALALTVSSATATLSSCKDKSIKPKTDVPDKKIVPDNCPACGMG